VRSGPTTVSTDADEPRGLEALHVLERRLSQVVFGALLTDHASQERPAA
jgi:hypothetical protein